MLGDVQVLSIEIGLSDTREVMNILLIVCGGLLCVLHNVRIINE